MVSGCGNGSARWLRGAVIVRHIVVQHRPRHLTCGTLKRSTSYQWRAGARSVHRCSYKVYRRKLGLRGHAKRVKHADLISGTNQICSPLVTISVLTKPIFATLYHGPHPSILNSSISCPCRLLRAVVRAVCEHGFPLYGDHFAVRT